MQQKKYCIFRPAYESARLLGMATGAIVTGVVACPAILMDWFYQHLENCFAKQATEHEAQPEEGLFVYDIPHLFAYEQNQSYPLYQSKHGFFSTSKPVKLVAEISGTAINALVSALTFTIVGVLEITAIMLAAPPVLILGIAALFAGGIYCLAQSYQKGFHQQCVETMQHLTNQVV